MAWGFKSHPIAPPKADKFKQSDVNIALFHQHHFS